MPVRTLNNVFCRNCSCAITPCSEAHGCQGWKHLGDGKHPCPGHKNIMTIAAPRKG